MLKGWVAVILCLAVLGAAATCGAQVRVTKSAGGKTSISLAGLQAGGSAGEQIFLRTLAADLERSGWFSVLASGHAALAVQGACRAGGATLQVRCLLLRAADRQTLLDRSFQGIAGDARRLAHEVADAMVYAAKGCRGIASTRIALVGNRTGAKELYVCDADGQNLRQYTRDRSISLAPAWDPSGQALVYTSYHNGFPDVYLINLATGRRRALAAYPGLNTCPAVSPDGTQMAVILSKDGSPELYVMSLKTGQLNRLTRTPRAAEASPAWAPDGRRLVFVSDGSGSPQLYVISRTDGQPRRISFVGTENVDPDWGVRGLIACASKRMGRYQICILDPNSGEQRVLTQEYGADYEDPAWAPDGRHIVCTRSQNYRPTVYLLDTMGDPPLRLLALPGDWQSPAWSPR